MQRGLGPEHGDSGQSNKSGQYRFEHVLPGEYRIAAELDGRTSSEVIQVSSSSSLRDLILRTEGLTSAEPSSQSPPKFEAAGVRGLIDPGGYSAPAGAAAATGLIEGMADIKRPENVTSTLDVKAWPCGMERMLRKEVDANPDGTDANRRMGEFYLAHERASQAIPFLQRAEQADPSDSKLSFDLAVAWIGTGQFDSARTVLTELVSKQPDPATYKLLAYADEGSGRFLQASKDYQFAANVEPNDGDLFGVGYELILAGSPSDAANAFRSAAGKYPKSVRLLLGLGTAEFLMNHASSSVGSFLLASDLNPADPRPYEFLAGVLKIYAGETDKVCASFKRFIDLAPRNGEAPYFYAQCMLQKRIEGDQSIAMSSIENLLKLSIALDSYIAKVHFQLGTLYSDEGHYDEAVREYEVALGLDPEMKECHYRLAIAYTRVGRNQDAARESKLFENARSQDSTSDAINIEKLISVIGPASGKMDLGRACPAQ